jgi:hypothetical protein
MFIFQFFSPKSLLKFRIEDFLAANFNSVLLKMLSGFLKTIGNYGLDGANYMATKTISFILNNYGPRLLKIDATKLIIDDIRDADKNIFKLGTLEFKELKQEICDSIFIVEKCTVTNPVIVVPWRSILTDATNVTIPSILIKASLTKAARENTQEISKPNLENSYLYAKPFKSVDLPSNESSSALAQDSLIQIYNEVNEILHQYFQKINCQIDEITIVLNTDTKILLKDISYQNNILEIKFIDFEGIGCIENLSYDFVKSEIKILNMNMKDSDTILSTLKLFPKLFLQSNPKAHKYPNDSVTSNCIQIFIENFKWVDMLLTSNILLRVQDGEIILEKISNIELPLVCFLTIDTVTSQIDEATSQTNFKENYVLKFADNVLIFNTVGNRLSSKAKTVLNAKIGSNESINKWIETVKTLGAEISKHFCYETETEFSFKIKSLDLHAVRASDGSVIDISAEEILCNDKHSKGISDGNAQAFSDVNILDFENIQLFYKNVQIKSNKCIISTTKTSDTIGRLSDLQTKTMVELFGLNAKKITDNSDSTNAQCLSLSIEKFNIDVKHDVNLHIDNGSVTNLEDTIKYIMEIVTDVKNIIGLQKEENNEQTESRKINLFLTDSKINHTQSGYNFNFMISKAEIDLVNLVAKKLKTDIFMARLGGDINICNLEINSASKNSVDVDSVKLFIDPEIFDDINYILGTLPKSDPIDEDEDEIVLSKKPIDSKNMKRLQEALQSSSLYQSPETFKEQLAKNISEASMSFPIVKLMKEFSETATKSNYVDKNNQTKKSDIFSLEIRSCHVYLYGSLYAMRKGNYFVSIVLRAISLTRKLSYPKAELGDSVCIKIKEPGTEDPDSGNISKVREDYNFVIKSGAVLDAATEDPNWKYLLKFNNGDLLKVHAYKMQSTLSMEIYVSKITAAIREESFVKLLSFISNSHKRPQTSEPLYITQFQISAVSAEISYLPATIENLTGSDMLSFKKMDLTLKSQTIRNQNDFSSVFKILSTNWKEDTLNIYNAVKLIPSLGIVQPYVSPATRMTYIIGSYLGSAGNKLKLREFTYSLVDGVNFVGSLASKGINHIWDLFKRDTHRKTEQLLLN